MAAQPKKKSNTSTSKKKSTSNRKPVSKKRISPNISSLKKNIIIVVGVLLTICFVALGYVLGKNNYAGQMPEIVKNKEHYSTKSLLDDLAQLKVTNPENEAVPIVKNAVVKNEKLEKIAIESEPHSDKPLLRERGEKAVMPSTLKQRQNQKISLAYRGAKPRLVIIIDDVHTQKQIQDIKNLGFKITPSIFPPYALAKESNVLAKQVKHSMIHLPMESGNAQLNKQYKTLKTTFTDSQMLARAKEIRELFPHSTYINNHTGSVFTSDYLAMKKLYSALKEEGFVFVDSYTIASSKVEKIAHEFGDAYVRRDVFLDNTPTEAYIHNQLKIAVNKAKKNGYAIAIGHPHKMTLKALSSAKHILNDVELVYIDDIYKKVL